MSGYQPVPNQTQLFVQQRVQFNTNQVYAAAPYQASNPYITPTYVPPNSNFQQPR